MRNTPMGGGFGAHAWFFGVAGFFGTLLVIALIATVVYLLVKRSKPRADGSRPGPQARPLPPPPAIQLLDERLARGDIEIDDYLNRKAALFRHPEAPITTAVTEPVPPVTEPAPATPTRKPAARKDPSA